MLSINQASQGEMFVAKKSPDERGDWESYNFILVHKTNYSDAVIKNLTKNRVKYDGWIHYAYFGISNKVWLNVI